MGHRTWGTGHGHHKGVSLFQIERRGNELKWRPSFDILYLLLLILLVLLLGVLALFALLLLVVLGGDVGPQPFQALPDNKGNQQPVQVPK